MDKLEKIPGKFCVLSDDGQMRYTREYNFDLDEICHNIEMILDDGEISVESFPNEMAKLIAKGVNNKEKDNVS